MGIASHLLHLAEPSHGLSAQAFHFLILTVQLDVWYHESQGTDFLSLKRWALNGSVPCDRFFFLFHYVARANRRREAFPQPGAFDAVHPTRYLLKLLSGIGSCNELVD